MKFTKKHSPSKKLIVSSTSMLLVAMLALGTATYAWFTTNASASANKITASTSKVSNLQVSRADHKWKDSFTYNYDDTDGMKPVSSSTGTDWFTATAASQTAFTKTGDFVAQTTAQHYWYAEQFNVMNNGGADVSNVKISIKVSQPEATSLEYLRIALVPTDEDNTNPGTFTSSVFADNTIAYNAAGAAATPETTVSITPKAYTTGVTVGTLTPGQAQYYNLYVWFEGQDEQCYNAKAGQILSDIEFKATGTQATN